MNRTEKPPDAVVWHQIGRRGIFRAFAVDNDGVFWIAVSKRMGVVIASAALTLAAVVITLSIIALSNTGSLGRQQKTLHSSSYGECHRVQVLRADVNQFVATIYTFVEAARVARASSYQSGRSARDREAAEAYQLIADAIRYIPETNCTAAVDQPLKYRPPHPIPERDAIKQGLIAPTPLPHRVR